MGGEGYYDNHGQIMTIKTFFTFRVDTSRVLLRTFCSMYGKNGFVEGLKGRRFGVEDSWEDYKQLVVFHYRNRKMLFSCEGVVVPRRFEQGQ